MDNDRTIQDIKAEIRAIQKETEAIINSPAFEDSAFESDWSRFVDFLREGVLAELLNELGIDVRLMAALKVYYTESNGRRSYKEYDIVAESAEELVVVKVETTLRRNDVNEFVKEMKEFTSYSPAYRSKSVFGAMAYKHCESESDLYAERPGLYVIQATGDSAGIVNAECFRPVSFTNGSSRRPRGHLRLVSSD